MSLSVLGVILIDMPDGFLSASGDLSIWGGVFSTIVSVLGLLCVAGFLLKNSWSLPIAYTIIFASVGVFSLAIPHDPIKSGALIIWQIYTGFILMFFTNIRQKLSADRFFQSEVDGYSRLKVWFLSYRRASSHILLVTVLQSLLVFGFNVTQNRIAMNIVFLMAIISIFIGSKFLLLMFQHGKQTRRETRLVIGLVAVSIFSVFFAVPVAAIFLFLSVCTIYVLILARSPSVRQGLDKFRDAPALYVLMSFIILISVGALFLSLPQASATGTSIGAVQAIFTAVSAACVTGLTVVSTGQDLSIFGQIIVLILVQLGGLGIMVLSTFATLAFGGRLAVRSERALSEFFEAGGVRSANNLVVFIIKSTIMIELIGAAILTYVFWSDGMELKSAIGSGVFHAISAFCNAGFALSDSSLVAHNTNPLVLITFSLLITLGGLGFFVMLELYSRFIRKTVNSFSIQAKLVLMTSLVITLGCTVIFCFTEWNSAFTGLSFSDKVINGFFHSVSARTAGFNAVEMGSFTSASIVIMIMIMFVGGAPGGTAGGVKVTTIGVLLATLPALLKNSSRISLFNRSLSAASVYKSAALITLSLTAVCIIWFVLLLSQDIDPLILLFEAFSTMGTTGLSMGATDKLDGFGQIVVSIGMFIGRIGPLTVAIAFGKETKSKVEYPNANIMIG